MYGFKFFVSVGAILVFIFATDNEVTAAPAPEPHPCLWILDYGHGHAKPTTTTTTVKPDLVEDFAKLKNKKTNQLEKYIGDLNIQWENGELRGQKTSSKLCGGQATIFRSHVLEMHWRE